MALDNNRVKIGAFWSKQFSKQETARTRWWLSPLIVRHINERVAGCPLDGLSVGLTRRAIDMAGNRLPFEHGVSVGCGTATLEIELLCANVVRSFKVFDLSEHALNQGKQSAAEKGVTSKIEFILGNAFELANEKECFDFIHWNDSLHHMIDVEEAVRWSFDVLKKGGMFYMNEYIGPNRFQWTDSMLEKASAVRKSLPQPYLQLNQNVITRKFKQAVKRSLIFLGLKRFDDRILKRPNISAMISSDPSEAADSERILDSVKKYFPQADITMTGGVVYYLALSDILQNFDESRDLDLLNELLALDDSYAEQGETLYATALAIKP